MIHEYTDDYYDTFADLMALWRRYARNTIMYPLVSWRK